MSCLRISHKHFIHFSKHCDTDEIHCFFVLSYLLVLNIPSNVSIASFHLIKHFKHFNELCDTDEKITLFISLF